MEDAINADGILVGFSDKAQRLRLERANRHGLVAGATGTGKTVTLQVIAQSLSDAGVPVFAADVKGDLSGISQPGAPNQAMQDRAKDMGLALAPAAPPVIFWDLFGQKGHPIRATVSEMGPLLVSRLLELNDVQEGVLNIAFRVADSEGLLLLDLKDLQAALRHIAEQSKTYSLQYGNISDATVGTIQRKLLTLENQGGANLFGEPALDLNDLMRVDASGKGYVNVLAADTLIQSPQLYATFLLWLISELFERLPEVGDPPKPKLVFFFDEAHLLFRDAPKALLDKIEQVVRLIRSKGVGVYFVTQNPADIPDTVLGQLGNRVQHALRAYTPAEQKGLRAAAESFRVNPAFDTADAIQALGVGEALVSLLDAKAAPTVTERAKIRPPASRLGPALPAERAATMAASPLKGVYDTPVDRESAFERLQARTAPPPAGPAQAAPTAAPAPAPAPQPRAAPAPKPGPSMFDAISKNAIHFLGSRDGQRIVRGILGGLLR